MSDETRARVQRALDELQYRPSRAARALTTVQVPRLGVVGYEIFESSTGRVLKGADEAAHEAGYLLDIVTVDPTGSIEGIAARLAAINSSDVAGLLATSPTVQIRAALDRSVLRMPVFHDVRGDVDTRPGLLEGTSVAAQQALGHLLDLGHRRIVHVAGPDGWESSAGRTAVYRRMLGDRGLPVLPVLAGDWSAASGYQVLQQAAWDPEVTAVFVANDRMAVGVSLAAQERGLRVPEDLSIIGIDDIPEAAYLNPPLSTVRIGFDEVGRTAVRSLISLIERPGAPLPDYPPSVLVQRATTAPPRR